jgi:phosphate starvation-inducible PhoH-like protein
LAKHKFAQKAPARQVQRHVERHAGYDEDRPRSTTYKGAKRPTETDNVLNFKTYVQQKKAVSLIPKSVAQEEYIDLLLNPEKLVIFATGPAGTGKTMLAVLAAIKAYKEGVIQKIIITRPAVGVDDEKHGFLPGDLNEKMAPWTRPIFDVMKEYYSPREIALMLEEETIEISPLAFLRGRTFKNAWIIFDEAQNSTTNQMKMVLTRIGDNSKMVITGDLNQNDRKFSNENGLRDFIAMLPKSKSQMIDIVQFSNRDIMRHEVVREVLELYGDI